MALAGFARARRRRLRRVGVLLGGASCLLLVAACSGPAVTPARAADLHVVSGQMMHLQCQGEGSPTVVLLGGGGFTTSTWDAFRQEFGSDVRTCAWDYPGVGHSTGGPLLTAATAAASLDGTLRAAGVPRPVVLVGHSVAGLTTRLFVSDHPADVAGVVLLDPTGASFARRFDEEEFRPAWNGTQSAAQVEQVTVWPDIPFEILRHDSAVYAEAEVWSRDVEAQWVAGQDAFAALAPRGRVRSVPGAGHNIHLDDPEACVAAARRVLAAAASRP